MQRTRARRVRLETFDEKVVKAYAALHPVPPDVRQRELGPSTDGFDPSAVAFSHGPAP
jgi:hypothetical protein